MLRQKLLGPTLVAYYPEEFGRRDPFMLDLQAERCVGWRVGKGQRTKGCTISSIELSHCSPPCRRAKLKLDRLRRRGKAPPKKGAGKRAGKKK